MEWVQGEGCSNPGWVDSNEIGVELYTLLDYIFGEISA